MSGSGRDAVLKIVTERGIQEVLHFTTNLGFVGCLATKAVLPRNRLKKEQFLQHILTLNAPFRAEEEDWFDQTEKWIDYVNLSISAISANLFRSSSLRWHAAASFSWVIMSFDPALMADEGVYFSTTNNIYPLTTRASGARGLEALFAPSVPRKPGWAAYRGARAAHLPTCEQAEVLYPKMLPIRYLRRLYVADGEDSDWAHCILSQYGRLDVQVVVNRTKFAGNPN